MLYIYLSEVIYMCRGFDIHVLDGISRCVDCHICVSDVYIYMSDVIYTY